MKIIRSLLLCLVLLAALASCKPGVPRQYIQPSKMEDILYDYHLAGGAAETTEYNERAYNDRLYKLAVLKKHGVSEAEFDSSMVYYMRHTERIHEIMKRVSEKISNQAVAMGADVSSMDEGQMVIGDTTRIWRGESSISLITNPPYNKYSFKVEADSSFHAGDRIILRFNTLFLYQDGMRDGLAMLVVKFKNDSIGSRVMHMSSSSRYNMEIFDNGNRGIKEIKGFFFLTREANSTTTTFKLMVVNQISMMRFHAKKQEKTAPPTDSVQIQTRDSLQPNSSASDGPVKTHNDVPKNMPPLPGKANMNNDAHMKPEPEKR